MYRGGQSQLVHGPPCMDSNVYIPLRTMEAYSAVLRNIQYPKAIQLSIARISCLFDIS